MWRRKHRASGVNTTCSRRPESVCFKVWYGARPWLNWIEHLTTDQEVGGSNPSGRAIYSTRESRFQ